MPGEPDLQPSSRSAALAAAGGEPTAIDEALAAWRADLGADAVVTDPAALGAYASSTLSQPVRAAAVVRPSSQEEVILAVRTAARYRVPLYPISRGRNWGYSDACPTMAGCVILDLGRMNRILQVDAELAYAVIEPAVTQGQLSDHLVAQGIPLWPDCTGAGPDTSIVGNVLDRGFGHTPYGNRANHVSGLEVVLSDGRLLKTGFGQFERSRVTDVFPYGVGPALDGLFTQSGMGIVTRMAVWLMPKPEAYTLFACSLQEDDDIASFVDDLRPLRLDGTVKSVIHMGNDLRVISSGMSYPKHLSPSGGPLPMEVRRKMRAMGSFGAWTIAGGLYGSKRQVAAARRELRARLAGRGRKLLFFDARKLDLADRVLRPLQSLPKVAGLRRKLAAVRAVYDMNRGRPSSNFLSGAYWKHPDGIPQSLAGADPARDGCGLFWLPPVLPFTGDAVREVLKIAEPIFERHGFDFFVTFSTVTERALSAIMTIAYDKTSVSETEAALACHDEVLAAVVAAGFPPYRLNLRSMAAICGQDSAYWKTVADLKRAMDPHAIIAPGRYQPSSANLPADGNGD